MLGSWEGKLVKVFMNIHDWQRKQIRNTKSENRLKTNSKHEIRNTKQIQITEIQNPKL